MENKIKNIKIERREERYRTIIEDGIISFEFKNKRYETSYCYLISSIETDSVLDINKPNNMIDDDWDEIYDLIQDSIVYRNDIENVSDEYLINQFKIFKREMQNRNIKQED